MKKHRLTKKYNVSEIMNSIKTKKYNIFNQVNNFKYKRANIFQNDVDNLKQKGGSLLGGPVIASPKLFSSITPNAATLSGITTNLSIIDSSKFDVNNEFDFSRVKNNVNLSITKAWFMKLINIISEKEYELTRSVLKMQLQFANMKLESTKMIDILNRLLRSETSGIKKVTDIIQEIFRLQQIIFNTPANQMAKRKFAFLKLKQLETDRLFEKQDKLRHKLMKYTEFRDDKHISSKCKWAFSDTIIALNEKGTTNTKEIICLLGSYRRREARFNKHYVLFKQQYNKFISTYPLCNQAVDVTLTGFFDAIKTSGDVEPDDSKCDLEAENNSYNKAFDAIVSYNSARLPDEYQKKTVGKTQEINEKFIKQNTSFKNIVDNFNKNLKLFKDIYILNETFGIRHYYGLPPKKKWFQGIRAFDRKIELKEADIKILKSNPTFIAEFTKTITTLAADAKDIFTANETSISNIIPTIYILNYNDREDSKYGHRPNKDYLTVFSINMLDPKIYDDKLIFNNLSNYNLTSTTPVPVAITTPPVPPLPDPIPPNPAPSNPNPLILCIQNGITEMINANSKFCLNFLQNKYIPVAYSSHGNKNNPKHNIIYVRKSAIDELYNKARDIVAVNQTPYFILNDLPEEMLLENHQKSFAVANFIFDKLPYTPMINLPSEHPSLVTSIVHSIVHSSSISGSSPSPRLSSSSLRLSSSAPGPAPAAAVPVPAIELRKLFGTFQEPYDNFKQKASDEYKISFNLHKYDDDSITATITAIIETIIKDSSNTTIDNPHFKAVINIMLKEYNTELTNHLYRIFNDTTDQYTIINTYIASLDKQTSENIQKNNLKLIELITAYTDGIIKIIKIKDLIKKNYNDDKEELNIMVSDYCYLYTQYNNTTTTTIGIDFYINAYNNFYNTYLIYIIKFYMLNIFEDFNKLVLNKKQYNYTINLYTTSISKDINDREKKHIANTEVINDIFTNFTNGITHDTFNNSVTNAYKYLLEIEKKLEPSTTSTTSTTLANTDSVKLQESINLLTEHESLLLNSLNSLTLSEPQPLEVDMFDQIYISFLDINKIFQTQITKLNILINTKTNQLIIEMIRMQPAFTTAAPPATDATTDANPEEFAELITELCNDEHMKVATTNINTLIPSIIAGGSTTPIKSTIGFTVLTTELVGSNPDDIYYLKQIIEFNEKKGLRKSQIAQMYNILDPYVYTNNIDIICGDFGGILENIYDTPATTSATLTMNEYLIKEYKDKYTNVNSITDTSKLVADIKKYYTNGMEELRKNTGSSYPKNENYLYTSFYTKNAIKTITNYIFYKNNTVYSSAPAPAPAPAAAAPVLVTVAPNPHTYGIHLNIIGTHPTPTNYSIVNATLSIHAEIDTAISYFGGILPIGLNFTVNPHTFKTQQIARQKLNSTNKLKLYSKDELKNIIVMLDTLMSMFGYSYKAYLKRDLGCFSFDDKNEYGKRIIIKNQNRLFNKNDTHAEKGDLITLYTMNFPSIIEVFLNKVSGFYNNSNNSNDFKYSNENQLSFSDNTQQFTKMNPVLKNISENNKDVNIDVIARLLIIPSDHINKIANINIKKISLKNYKQLNTDFCNKFYRDIVLKNLEKELDTLLTNTNTKDVKTNFISELIQTDSSGNLKNIGSNPDLIAKLYYFVSILLRLKFIDKQIDDMSTKTIDIQSSIIIPEKLALQSFTLYNTAIKFFELIRSVIFTYKMPTDTTITDTIKTDFDNLTNSNNIIKDKDTIIKETLESKIQGLIGLQYLESYIARLLLIGSYELYNLIAETYTQPAKSTVTTSTVTTSTVRIGYFMSKSKTNIHISNIKTLLPSLQNSFAKILSNPTDDKDSVAISRQHITTMLKNLTDITNIEDPKPIDFAGGSRIKNIKLIKHNIINKNSLHNTHTQAHIRILPPKKTKLHRNRNNTKKTNNKINQINQINQINPIKVIKLKKSKNALHIK